MQVELETAVKAKEAWRNAFPEMDDHLNATADMYNPGMYRTRTSTGFVRGNARLTAINNTEFQSLSGDGASEMLWACYQAGLPMVNFIHDEILQELLITNKERMVQHLQETERVMVESMCRVIPDVKIAVESAMMTRWFKEAEPVMDADGSWRVMDGFYDLHNEETGETKSEPLYVSIDDIIAKNKQN